MNNTIKIVFLRLFASAIFLALSAGAQAGLLEAKAAYKKKDFSAALKEFKSLADSGNAEAQFYVGLMNDNDEGEPQDYRQVVTRVQQAITWYRKSAEQGYAPAQANLGALLETGGQLDRNYKEAESWYRKAAMQGNAAAQFNLGLMYNIGRGDDIPRDYAEAASWYRKAAEQGDTAAQNSLGRMYEYGQGMGIDYVQAYKWYILAKEAGSESAQQNIESVEQKITPEESGQAHALAKEWREKHK